MRRKAILLAVVTTFLWAGSYIFNKIAFQEGIGPLTLSGLRYFLAALFLMVLGGGEKQNFSKPLSLWALICMGLLGYAAAQGLQYLGQAYLTPTQSSLFLSVGNTMFVVLLDRLWLRENQTGGDFLKMALLLGGVFIYYYPWGGADVSVPGAVFMGLSSVAYALNMTINRRLLTTKRAGPRQLVAKPMLAGALALLLAGFLTEGAAPISWKLVLIMLYLSGVSGALGFYLWTWSQKWLTAFETSGINNLMLIEIALMDFLVFGRKFALHQVAAIFVVFLAIIAIQRKPKKA